MVTENQDREGNLISSEFFPNAWPTNGEVRLAWGPSSKVTYGGIEAGISDPL